MSTVSQPKRERTPLNAEGDFYVEEGTCLWCMAPQNQAPELMGFDKRDGCFFRRQPQTPEEVTHAINAVQFSCVQALHYSGNDSSIIDRLRSCDCGHLCDGVS